MTRRRHIQDERAPRTRTLPGEALSGPPSWTVDALCAQMDGDICPVQLACAAYIFDIDPRGATAGVWGAMTQRDRQRLARRSA